MSATRYANLSGPAVIKCKLGRRQQQIFPAPSRRPFIRTDWVSQGLPSQRLWSCLAGFSAANGKTGPSPLSESISRFQRQAGLEVAGPLCLNALPDPRHLAFEQEVVGTATRPRFSFHTLRFELQACTKQNKMEINEGKSSTNDPINKILLLCFN